MHGRAQPPASAEPGTAAQQGKVVRLRLQGDPSLPHPVTLIAGGPGPRGSAQLSLRWTVAGFWNECSGVPQGRAGAVGGGRVVLGADPCLSRSLCPSQAFQRRLSAPRKVLLERACGCLHLGSLFPKPRSSFPRLLGHPHPTKGPAVAQLLPRPMAGKVVPAERLQGLS